METKKEIKARKLGAFREILGVALEEAIESASAIFETEKQAEEDAVILAWDSAFDFTGFETLIRKNFNRGFEAAWKAFEKAKRENP